MPIDLYSYYLLPGCMGLIRAYIAMFSGPVIATRIAPKNPIPVLSVFTAPYSDFISNPYKVSTRIE